MATPREADDDSRYSKPGEYNDPAQKFWSIYVSEAHKHDTNVLESWKENTDSTLIFAGLFSAIVTAFLIESCKLLKQDPTDVSTALLTQLVSLQLASSFPGNTSVPLSSSVVSVPFTPSAVEITINILWFLSLGCSLGVALCVTLVQQWIREYLQTIQKHTAPLRRATVRTFLFEGLESWGMDMVVAVYIPTMLHSSLFLFFVGLCLYLSLINPIVTWTMVSVSGFNFLLYGIATIAPAKDPSAPYQTPLSPLAWFIAQNIRRSQGDAFFPFTLTIRRDEFAISSSPVDRLQRDQRALQWACQMFPYDAELQPLVESIPGLLSSQDGRDVWDISSTPGMPITTFGSRISALLATCLRPGLMDPGSRLTRATVCLDALFAILQYSRGTMLFGADLPRTLDRIASLEWDDVLERKVAYVKVLLDCRSPPRVKWKNVALPTSGYNFNSPIRRLTQDTQAVFEIMLSNPTTASQYDLPALLEKADNALRDVDELRCELEELLMGRDIKKNCTLTTIAATLQRYMKALTDGNRDLHACTKVLQDFLARAYPPKDHKFPLVLMVFFWLLNVHHDPSIITYQGIPHLEGGRFQGTFAVPRVLALLRRIAIYQALPAFPTTTTMPFPLVDNTRDEYLTRELLPISACLSLLSPDGPDRLPTILTSNIRWYRGDWQVPWFYESGVDLFILLTDLLSAPSRSRRPFGTFAYVMDDLKDGGKVLELASFIRTIEHEAARGSPVEHSVIGDVLDVLWGRWDWEWPYPFPGGPEEVEPPAWSLPSLRFPLPGFIFPLLRVARDSWNDMRRGRLLQRNRANPRERRTPLCEGSQMLLLGIFGKILDMERAVMDGNPCLLPKAAVDHILELIKERISLELPIQLAEEFFGTAYTIPEPQDFHVDDPSTILRNRALGIHDHISREREQLVRRSSRTA